MNNADKMDPQIPAGEWFPGPEDPEQPYPIINDISGTPLKAELVVPPPDRVSQGARTGCLCVLKLPIPDPKVWSVASYATVRKLPASVGGPPSPPSCESTCESNTENTGCRGDTRSDDGSTASDGSLEDFSQEDAAGLCMFEHYYTWMFPARKLNVDGKGDFLYFLIGGKKVKEAGKVRLSIRVYIHVYAKYSCQYGGRMRLSAVIPPEELWVNANGFYHDEKTVYYSPGAFVLGTEIDVYPEGSGAEVQRGNPLSKFIPRGTEPSGVPDHVTYHIPRVIVSLTIQF